jgi:hypothetical protein
MKGCNVMLVLSENNKTLISKGLTYGKKSIMLDGRLLTSTFFFSRCDKDTEAVIIDDLSWNSLNIEFINLLISEGLIVDRPAKPEILICPDIIINFLDDNSFNDDMFGKLWEMYEQDMINIIT